MKCRGRDGAKNPSWKGTRDIPHAYFTILKRGAAERGLTVNITIDDLQAEWERCGGVCAMTGLPINLKGKRRGQTASVDRIDPAHGYEPWNIQWVHKDVNLMRNRFDVGYFVDMCRLVTSKHAHRKLFAA